MLRCARPLAWRRYRPSGSGLRASRGGPGPRHNRDNNRHECAGCDGECDDSCGPHLPLNGPRTRIVWPTKQEPHPTACAQDDNACDHPDGHAAEPERRCSQGRHTECQRDQRHREKHQREQSRDGFTTEVHHRPVGQRVPCQRPRPQASISRRSQRKARTTLRRGWLARARWCPAEPHSRARSPCRRTGRLAALRNRPCHPHQSRLNRAPNVLASALGKRAFREARAVVSSRATEVQPSPGASSGGRRAFIRRWPKGWTAVLAVEVRSAGRTPPVAHDTPRCADR